MAVNNGIEIDDIYRNINGISFQMLSMESAYLGKTVRKPATRLFDETVALYRENRPQYEKLLKEARSMLEKKQTNEDAFAAWLTDKVSSSQLSHLWPCYHDIESFCRKIGILKRPLFEVTDLETVKKVQKTVSSNKLFTIMHKKKMKWIMSAAQLYTAFTKERSATVDSKDVCSSVTPPVNEPTVTATPIAQEPRYNRPSASESEIKIELTYTCDIVDFRDVQILVYTRPTKVEYFGRELQFAPSWTDAYVKLFTAIYEDYSHLLAGVTSFTKSGRLDLCDKTRVGEMLDPKPVNDGLFLETNLSAQHTVQRIKSLLDLCNVDYKNVVIEYESKQGSASADKKPVSASTSISASAEPSMEERFYAYMLNTLNLSENTCRSYLSAVHSAEEYAKEHEYSDYQIFNNSSDGAAAVIRKLLQDDEFLSYNLSQHNRFSAAFKKYAIFLVALADSRYEKKYPSLYTRLLSASKVYDDPGGLSIDRISSIINEVDQSAVADVLDHVSWAAKITDGVYSFSRNPYAEPAKEAPTIAEPVEPSDYTKDRFIEVLMHRYRNGMTFDAIDFDIFRETYEMLFDEKIPFDDSELEDRIRYCGVLYKDRVFPADGIIDPETREKLYAYIENSFASGKTVLYYKAIFTDLSDTFASCYTLADEEMLREYVKFTAEKGKYFFTEKYLSIEQNVAIDHNAEVAGLLLAAGKPMTIEAIASALSHIPQEQVQNIIYFDNRFLRNSKGEFFHKDIFEVSDDDLEAIADIISSYIDENEYAIWTDVWNQIKEKMPMFLENNLYLSWLGIRNAIAPFYTGRFNFNSAVISSLDKRYEMKDIFQLFAKHHPSFTADDIYSLAKELDTPVALYLWAIAEVSVRVSYDLFVSKEQIAFDIEAIDKAIESFMAKDYICLREIDSFLSFPNVGYEWNSYLLESYVLSYSKKLMLLNNGMALNNAPGAIVKRGSAYTEFVDVCAAILADSGVQLKKDTALNYLADQNLITQRRYKHIELAIQKATQIRARKR